MLNDPTLTPETKTCVTKSCCKCISWSAVVAGALTAIGLGFLIHVFTSGLGLSLYTTDTTGLTTLAIGTFIWLLVAGYFAMFFSGFVSGALTRYNFGSRCAGAFHGFIAWCLAIAISLILTAHVGMATTNLTQATKTTPDVVNVVGTVTDNKVPTTTVEKTNNLGIGVLSVFFVFLIGAIGSTVGGYFGAQYKGHDYDKTYCDNGTCNKTTTRDDS
jgi:hypothetical protein